ncbi:hypothetical protein Y032_0059g3037 [Ancylostoma ceylanicum]|uniref:Uncharacterized protein n=1 Tax=Ancylostoma ceylanicum TaxID=53326 RepID=A0A016U455_9BILA|nr:hypothetical protein Y032_0059g3037 [Ancylostoma ceylanicum]
MELVHDRVRRDIHRISDGLPSAALSHSLFVRLHATRLPYTLSLPYLRSRWVMFYSLVFISVPLTYHVVVCTLWRNCTSLSSVILFRNYYYL